MPKNSNGKILRPFNQEASLRSRILEQLTSMGLFEDESGGPSILGTTKNKIRELHAEQRTQRLNESRRFISDALPETLPHFAQGHEIDPKRIRLSLRRVYAGSKEAQLFRLASLTWSVPVSRGFGRRLRYLIWDDAHDKIFGIMALGDPVFNLSTRDKQIGWSSHDRSERLTNILDAYVLGALPPYNMLLGGKVAACLVKTRDVYFDFLKTYGNKAGTISKKDKSPKLLAVTTSSSLGRSSVYNRLKIGDEEYFRSIGYTTGWGHLSWSQKTEQ